MKPEVLIAWIETEGSITLSITHDRIWNPAFSIQIAQKDHDTIHRIQKELGMGDICINNSQVEAIRFRKKEDLERLFSIIDSVPESSWYTKKLKQYKAGKEYIKFINSRLNERWTRDQFNILLELRGRISPNYKYSDDELIKAFESRLEKINKTKNMWNGRKQSIINSLKIGVSKKEIAIQYDISVGYLYVILKRLGISLNC